MPNRAVISDMNTMELDSNQDSYIKIIKWISVLLLLSCSVFAVKSLYQHQKQTLIAHSALMQQKSSLITQMHKEMLSITRTQYQILHASSQEEVRQLLWSLSEQVSDYLIYYHRFEGIANHADAEILVQLRNGFDQWHGFNKELLAYANVISDSGFINTLNMIDLAFSQFDSDTDEAVLLIAQLKQSMDNTSEISN